MGRLNVMQKRAVIVARGLHEPWATGIASYGRLLVEWLAEKKVYDELILEVIPDYHRLRGPLSKSIQALVDKGVVVKVSERRLVRKYKDVDVHVLAERTIVFGRRVFKYLFVHPPSRSDALFARVASRLYGVIASYVATSPLLRSVYRVDAHLLPPRPWYVDQWGVCEPRILPPWDDFLLYIGWVRPERLPVTILSRVLDETGLGLVVFGRESEDKYGEASYISYLEEKFPGMIRGYNLVLRDCEKRWYISKASGLLFVPVGGYLQPPVVDPPLIVMESVYLNTPVIATPVLSLPWLSQYCGLVRILDEDSGILPGSGDCSELWRLIDDYWDLYFKVLVDGL